MERGKRGVEIIVVGSLEAEYDSARAEAVGLIVAVGLGMGMRVTSSA